jgi:hypothetical protein
MALGVIGFIVLGTSVWVLFDSIAIGGRDYSGGINNTSPFGWFLFCLLIWIVGFPLYLSRRPSLKLRAATKTLVDRNGLQVPYQH